MKTVKVLKIRPGKHPVPAELESSIEAFNRAISIGADELCKACSKKLENSIYILYNPYGCYYDLAANRKVSKEIIVGVFYVIGVDADYHPRSLTKSEIEKYMSLFWEPETYSDSDIIENNLDMVYDSLEKLEKL